MKINIGGGYKKYDGFINVDMDPLTKPDILMDMEKDKFPIEDNTVTEVKAYQILEHIGEGFLGLMQELYRICKDGAIIDIEVPHHRHENYFGDPTHKRPITVDTLRLFSKKYNEWHIKTHNSSSGFGLRLNVDFEIFEFEYYVDPMYAELAKQGKQEQLEQMARQINNVYTDLKIKLIVVK